MKPLYVKKNGVVYKISGNGMPALYPAENVEYDNTVTSELQATDVQGAIDELSTRQGGVKNTAYGTCNTTGDVKDKVATLVDATNWILEVGTIVGVRFTYTNTYTPSSGNNVTLNVNNTGAKNIRYSDGIRTGTDDIKCPTAYGESGQTIYYMYDGTYWVWVSHSKDNDTLYNFEGNEFRSIDGNNYGHEIGYGGNANSIKVNGHYYYNSNGPSTAIGASANDGALYVQAFDSDYAVQIAQNYENGNIFVRGLNDGTWTDWKKPIANIAGNNTVLTTDKTPFLTRQTLNPTGFSGYVREKLIGCSVAWNNILSTQEDVTRTVEGITYTNNNNGSYTINGTATAASYWGGLHITNDLIANHVYLFYINSNKVRIWDGYSGQYISVGCNIVKKTSWSTFVLYLRVESGTSISPTETVYPQIIDLTLAFGSSVADTLYAMTNNGGIDWLRNHNYPIDQYTQYGYGLYSSNPSAKKVQGGFNLWDEEWELGQYSTTTGEKTSANANIRCKNFIRVSSSTAYYITVPSGTYTCIFFYTESHSFISSDVAQNSRTFTTPSSCKYMTFQCGNDYGTTYGKNICINVSTTTGSPKNGDYVPAQVTTYSLGSTELRGHLIVQNGEIVAEGDARESNGEVKRKYGIVDLGTLTWTYRTEGSVSGLSVFSATMPSTYKKGGSVGFICGGGYCANGLVGGLADMANKQNKDICLFATNGTNYVVYLRNTAYTDATQLKTSLDGVYMYFELETSTTETSSPFADPMSLNGCTTEEYVDDRSIPVPVGHETQYMGQSEDVVEIPSSPLSDGKRVLVAETNNGNTVNYFGDLGLLFEDVSSKITKYHNTTVTNFNVLYAYKIGRLVSFSFRATISGDGYGRLATLDKSLLPKNSNYFFFNTITTTQGDYNLRGYFAGTNLDVAGLDSSISIDLAVNATYIT